jgi:hypothetical protein
VAFGRQRCKQQGSGRQHCGLKNEEEQVILMLTSLVSLHWTHRNLRLWMAWHAQHGLISGRHCVAA